MGPPTNKNVVRLRETIINVLLSIHVSGEKQCLLGLIVPDANYRAEHGASFDPMTNPLDNYNPSILLNAKNNDRVRAERIWTAKLERQRLIRTTKCKACNLIISAVKDTCIFPLKSFTIFYNKVAPRDMLNHLSNNSGGLDTMDVVTLQVTMLGWWAEDPCVPEYINRLEDGQKKAKRGRLLIIDNWLAAIALTSLLNAGAFPRKSFEWDSLSTASKM